MKLTVLLLLFVAGCGYQFAGGKLPGDVQYLSLPIAINKTAEPLLENVLSAPLSAVLARQQHIELVESDELAEAVLQATITDYTVVPISYSSNDRISAFNASLTINFTLRRQVDGKLIWQGTLQRQTTYSAAADKNLQEDLESIAIESMAKDIADDLIYRLVTRF